MGTDFVRAKRNARWARLVLAILNDDPDELVRRIHATGIDLSWKSAKRTPRKDPAQQIVSYRYPGRSRFTQHIDDLTTNRRVAGDLQAFALRLRDMPIPIIQTALMVSRLWRCQTCSRFFIARDDRRRAYCPGKKCKSRRSRTAYRQTIRARQKRALAEAAQAALKSWNGVGNWKQHVARALGVKKNAISYAVARGDIAPPAAHRTAHRTAH